MTRPSGLWFSGKFNILWSVFWCKAISLEFRVKLFLKIIKKTNRYHKFNEKSNNNVRKPNKRIFLSTLLHKQPKIFIALYVCLCVCTCDCVCVWFVHARACMQKAIWSFLLIRFLSEVKLSNQFVTFCQSYMICYGLKGILIINGQFTKRTGSLFLILDY